MSALVLKRAPIGWNQDDFDVLEDGVIVGRIFKVPIAPADAATTARSAGRPMAMSRRARLQWRRSRKRAARVTLRATGPFLTVVGAPLLTAQQRRSPQPIPTQENLSELLMVTDAKLGLQNRRHDAMSGRFGLLVRGVRSGDTDCAGPDNCHPNRNRHYDELADAAWHDRLHLMAHSITLSLI
jgi:hypothetical protein